MECARQRRAILRFGSYCFDYVKKKPNREDFGLTYATFWKRFIRDSSALSYRVEQLSSEERLELLTCSERVYEDPSNSWDLEDLDSRHMMFSYFGNPSEQEKSVYETELEKRGWSTSASWHKI